jgi:hypothetical protein
VPDIPSKRFEENRAFYMDFLGMKLAMDIDFILTFVSQSNPTAQVSIVRDAGASASAANVALTVEVADVDEMHVRAIERGLKSSIRLRTSGGACAGSLWPTPTALSST